MRALIFGCGYLGRRVASVWSEAHHEVFALTRSHQNAETLRRTGIQPFIGDVCESATLNQLPSVDVVLHAIGFDRNSGKTQEEVTCGGTANILAALQKSCRRFIQISSTSVYGQSEGEWVNEQSQCTPTQAGGKLNLAAEKLVLDHFATKSGCSGHILRLAGIYGPNRLLSRLESLKSNIAIAGRGDSWLNLIHVDDAVSAIIACASAISPQQIYNVVDNQPIRRQEYFGLLAQLMQAPEPQFDPNQTRDRGSGGLNKRCSNALLRESLDWNPKYPSIVEGLPQAINGLVN